MHNKAIATDTARGVHLRECRSSIISRKRPPHAVRQNGALASKGKAVNSYIYNFVGRWKDGSGNELIISAVDDYQCSVTLISAQTRKPLMRPWLADAPAIDMTAKYYPEHSPCLDIELGEEGSGFCLSLDFDFTTTEYREIQPAIDRFATDSYLDQYYHHLGKLETFHRVDNDVC